MGSNEGTHIIILFILIMKLLSTSYFPSITYFSKLIKEEQVLIEHHEHFVKQTHRNRCVIASPQGMLSLSVPLINEGNKTITGEKKIAYTENWQAKHWRAIESSYNKSAYFEYFEEELKKTLFIKHEYLVELNTELTLQLLHILRLKCDLLPTENYQLSGDFEDEREEQMLLQKQDFPAYYQVFSNKTGFLHNLSVIDLIFNEGLNSIPYLRNI